MSRNTRRILAGLAMAGVIVTASKNKRTYTTQAEELREVYLLLEEAQHRLVRYGAEHVVPAPAPEPEPQRQGR